MVNPDLLLPGTKFTREGDLMEESNKVTFTDFKRAMKVFSGDYGIVDHSELKPVAPWDEPNPPGVYSLTQIPEGMAESDFVEELREVTDFAITCMDKDCAHSTWSKLQKSGGKTAMFTWGGGVIQHNLEGREKAVESQGTIAQYLRQLWDEGELKNLKQIYCDDHDSVCGAVKAFLGGEPLHELLSRWTGREITEHSTEEDEFMEMLVRQGANVYANAFAGTGVEVVAELHYTDRKDPRKSRLDPIELGADLPEMDVAAILAIDKMKEK